MILQASPLCSVVPAFAIDDGCVNPVVIQCSVSVRPGVQTPLSDAASLYVTARPDKPDNVPAAILSGTRGKPPPVLAARFPLSTLSPTTFPYMVDITEANLTPVGVDRGGRWWERDNVSVTARLDSDGVAATRSPDDLIGRTISRPQVENSQSENCDAGRRQSVDLELQGRGIGGKLITKRQ
jgi:hypothetical protein